MSKQGIFRGYLIFTIGLLFAALGISLITTPGLGTSPITSISLVFSFILKVSLGTCAFLFNALLFLGEIALLRKEFQKIQILQLPATLVFSVAIDFFSSLLSHIALFSYGAKVGMLLCGCIALGLGVALEVLADVIILPGEGIVKALAQVLHKEFGLVKTVVDLSFVALAALFSITFLGTIVGIREGTVIAALIVGTISRFFRKRLFFLNHSKSAKALEPDCDSFSSESSLPISGQSYSSHSPGCSKTERMLL